MQKTPEDRNCLACAFPFWAQLTADEQEMLCRYTRPVHYRKGARVHSPLESCVGILLLRTGQLRAYLLSEDGRDVTEQFLRGTAEALRLCDLYHCKAALLKERSPSCGSHFVYDGTFTGTVVPGQGVTAALLAGRGVELFSEETIARLLLLYGPEEM